MRSRTSLIQTSSAVVLRSAALLSRTSPSQIYPAISEVLGVTRVPRTKTARQRRSPDVKKGEESLQRLTPLPLKATISEFLARSTKVMRTEARAATWMRSTRRLGTRAAK